MATLLRRSADKGERRTHHGLVRYGMGGAGLALALVACAGSATPGQPRVGAGSGVSITPAPVSANTSAGPASAPPSAPTGLSTPPGAPSPASGVASAPGLGDGQSTVTPTPRNGRIVLTNADASGTAYVAVPVGTVLEVDFDAFTPPPATIEAPHALDNSILQMISSSGDQTRHSRAVFRAVAVGKVGIVASEYGACKGACTEPALGLFIDVVR